MPEAQFYYHECDLSHLGALAPFQAPDGTLVTALQASLEPAYRQDNAEVVYVVQPAWTEQFFLLNEDFVPMDQWGHRYEGSEIAYFDCTVPDEGEVYYFPYDPDRLLWDFMFPVQGAFYFAEQELAKIHKYTFCFDCGMRRDGEDYMVFDGIWELTGLDQNAGVLCVGCIGKRIGRQLTWEDFTSAPINWAHGDTNKSERLLSRLRNADGYSRTDLEYFSTISS